MALWAARPARHAALYAGGAARQGVNGRACFAARPPIGSCAPARWGACDDRRYREWTDPRAVSAPVPAVRRLCGPFHTAVRGDRAALRAGPAAVRAHDGGRAHRVPFRSAAEPASARGHRQHHRRDAEGQQGPPADRSRAAGAAGGRRRRRRRQGDRHRRSPRQTPPPDNEDVLIEAIRRAKAKVVLAAADERVDLPKAHIDQQAKLIAATGRPAGYVNLATERDWVVQVQGAAAGRLALPQELRHPAGGKVRRHSPTSRIGASPGCWSRSDHSDTFLTIPAEILLKAPDASTQNVRAGSRTRSSSSADCFPTSTVI